MNKLSAFTITELMVVSILSTICTGAAFSGFQVIQEQYFSYEKETEMVLEVGELQKQLQIDILAAKILNRKEEGLWLSLPEYDVVYIFTAEALHREVKIEGVRKTIFPIKIEKIQTSFKGNIIDQGILDFLTLDVDCEGNLFSLSFQKEYSATELMK